MCGDILRHTLEGDFGAPKVKSDIQSDFLIYDLCLEIGCSIQFGASLDAPKVESDTWSDFRFEIYWNRGSYLDAPRFQSDN